MTDNLLSSIHAQGWGGWGPGMMGGYGYGHPFGWFGVILMSIFAIAVLVGAILLIRWAVVSSREPEREDAAMEILRRRFANGEISKEEFEEKSRILRP